MENREFTLKGIKLVHNVKGEVIGKETEKLQERLNEFSALLELEEVSEEEKNMVRMFTSAIEKRISDLKDMKDTVKGKCYEII